MTREINFLTSIRSGLSLYTGWSAAEQPSAGKLAPSAFPSFFVSLGAAKYTRFGFTGQAVFGEQPFTITINFTEHQLKYLDASAKRSDLLSLAENYLNTFYIPPALGAGELYRIERLVILRTDGAVIDKDDTRFTAKIEGKYFFTLF